MGYYVVKFLLDTTKLQEDNTTCGQVLNLRELAVKYSYLIIMQSNTNFIGKIIIINRSQLYPH